MLPQWRLSNWYKSGFIRFFPMKKTLDQIRDEALKHAVPIMSDNSIEFIAKVASRFSCSKILEIGTAVGYSSLKLLSLLPDVHITTIERDEKRFEQAAKHIDMLEASESVRALCMDAFDYLPQEWFDLLIIDGAKAQNQAFFDRFFPFVSKRGVVIVDNIDFHGHVSLSDSIGNDRRNLRQMVQKIAKFEQYVYHRDDLIVEKVNVGDGMMVIYRKER